MVESIFVAGSLPKLAAKARLKFDKVREKHLLLLPEKVVVLNETAASILRLCDGSRTTNTITESIWTSLMAGSETRSSGVLPGLKTMEADISEFLQEMAVQGWVVVQHENEEP
ncbi:pyrroloquinoline quinone biosynthesis peptide chaperone PqqD [Neobacillus cucumis]|uniref:pyrroloquinoline quinone biosynthesis peptide chaperone PqqD n=1 Tax=Neobacillus cucumis TaxID=1740721 RepID=UPI00203C0061|nr:pyrroloquinoline quinone biosynthesis peptide chaperone PqqD [Neobacillus cucumis]MCM3728604.1 pyrroloquinoline quinone biosynthesis peptide chaperone PqqD [Neobacillus cucumis]